MPARQTNNSLQLEPALKHAEAQYRQALPSGWRGSCCAALLDTGCRIAATTQTTRMVEISSAGSALHAFFAGKWQDGDVAITNDPYHGSSHLLRFTAISPVGMRTGTDMTGFAALHADLSDMGGWEIGGDDPRALDIWAEGARIVPVKSALGGRMRRELLELLGLNSRTPNLVQRAVASLSGAVMELARQASAKNTDLGAMAARARQEAAPAIAETFGRFPKGAHHGTGRAGVPGFPGLEVQIEIKLTVADGALKVDILRAPEKSVRPINATPAMTRAAVLQALEAGLRLEPPVTLGLEDKVQVTAPQGSAVAVNDWLPVGYARRATCRAVFSAVLESLAVAGFKGVDGDQWWRAHNGIDEADIDASSGKASASRRSFLQSMEAAAGARA